METTENTKKSTKRVLPVGQFLIQENMFNSFNEKFEKLTRKAQKLGMTAIPSYVVVELNDKMEIQVPYTTYSGNTAWKSEYVPAHLIQVSGEQPVINGWSFIGSIDHLGKDEHGNVLNILNSVNTDSMKEWANAASDCEHCNHNRKRNSTFVLKNEETKVLKQVGSTCLKDFLGWNESPESIANKANLIFDCFRLAEDMEEMGYASNNPGRFIDTDVFLFHVATCIRLYGWTSKKDAMNKGMESTASAALTLRYSSETSAELELKKAEIDPKTISDLVNSALNWAKNLTEEQTKSSDYLHNLRVLSHRIMLENKHFGYMASVIPAYQRSVGEELTKKTAKSTDKNEFMGTVGQRLEGIECTLISATSHETEFGVTIRSVFKTTEGNSLIWWGTGFSKEEFDLGQTKKIKFSVKSHKVYNNIYQTVITRANLYVEKPVKAPRAKKATQIKAA